MGNIYPIIFINYLWWAFKAMNNEVPLFNLLSRRPGLNTLAVFPIGR